MKEIPPYSPEFLALLRECELPIQHLHPQHTSSIAFGGPAAAVEAMRGLATAYGVPAVALSRAAWILGLETLLGTAVELGHYEAPKNHS